MPETERIVIDAAPLISLVAALGDLKVLQSLYSQVLVPFEVCQEILVGGSSGFAVAEFDAASWLQKWLNPLEISPPLLSSSLDRGEAAVIQLAINEKIPTVCIDETVGRRFAKLNGLLLTGSIGILLRAKKEGYSFSMQEAIERMKNRGIRLSEKVVTFALDQAGESDGFDNTL
jgi:predicted nucleic acid-binding protein